MKRLLFVVLAVMLLVGVAVSTSQADLNLAVGAIIKTSVWTGTTADGTTPTAGSALTAGNRIIGWSITGSSNPQAGLYDTTTALAKAGSGIFDEPACASNNQHTVFYPAPKVLDTSLVVIRNSLTAGYCTVVVFYE